MTPHAKWGIAGIIIGFILLFITGVPWEIAVALIVLAIAVPAGAWLMLDESQRRRYRELRRRPRGVPARPGFGQRPRPRPVRDRHRPRPRSPGEPRAVPPGLGGWHAGRPGRRAGQAAGGGRAGGGERPPGVQVAVRQGPQRHRVRGHVAGARRRLGRRDGRRRHDPPARPGRRDRALGPGPADRRGGRLTHVTLPISGPITGPRPPG